MSGVPRHYRFITKSSITDKVLDFAKNAEFTKVHGGIVAADLPGSLFDVDMQITKLINYFKIEVNSRISVFKFSPYTCYKWHTDGIRSCAINMLLDGYDSKVYFGNGSVISNYITDVEEMVYMPNTYTFFNTSVIHTVYNFSKVRYLLSLGIPREFSKDEVWQYIVDNQL